MPLTLWLTASRPISPNQSGVALVLVLWMLALLSVIASSLVFSTRTELLVTGNLASLARAEAIADAGIYRAIHELSAGQTVQADHPARWKPDGLSRHWQYGDADVWVAISDESGKIDLNMAQQPLLAGLFRAVGVEQAVADALADAVVDWRDEDSLRSAHGAEKDDYTAAGRDYVPANTSFETVAELRQVLGIDDALFGLLERLVTVYSQQAGINSAFAPREVLLAVPGATPEMVDAYIEQRRLLLEQGLPAPAFPPAQGLTAPSGNSAATILVSVFLRDNTRFFREAVVRIVGSGPEPVAVLAWRAPLAVDGPVAPGTGIVDPYAQSR